MFPRVFHRVSTKFQRCNIHHGRLNYFDILGIAENEVDINKIKFAFRKKAKELHPDILRSKNISVEDAHVQFVALRNAYEILVDPLEREKYKRNLRHGTDEINHNQHYTTSQHTKAHHGFKYRKDTNAISPFQLNSWDDFQKELDLALDMVYYGPSFHSTEEQPFPENMETEELRSFQHQGSLCILHIVHGRQFLGEILFVEEPSQLFKELREETGIANDATCLELKWGGVTLAVGCRFMDNHLQKIQLWYKESPNASKFESSLLVHQNESSFLKFAPDQYFMHGEDTHFIIRNYSPGVQSLLIYNKKFRFLEYKCTRAWLPSSMFWMFEPRDKNFDGGGWYIENNRDGQHTKYRSGVNSQNTKSETGTIAEYNRGFSMHPAVCLLICGFSSLDRMRK